MTPAKASGITRRVLDADDVRLIREAAKHRDKLRCDVEILEHTANRKRVHIAELSIASLARKFDVNTSSVRRALKRGCEA